MPSVAASTYRSLLKCCGVILRNSRRHGIEKWDDLPALLRRTHSFGDAKRSAPDPFFPNTTFREKVICNFPDLTGAVRKDFRVAGSPGSLVAAFEAIRVLGALNTLYDAVLGPRPVPAADAAFQLGEVVSCRTATAEVERCVVIGYRAGSAEASGEAPLEGYYTIRCDGEEVFVATRDVAAAADVSPLAGFDDAESLFVGWCDKEERYLPNPDLAYKWQQATTHREPAAAAAEEVVAGAHAEAGYVSLWSRACAMVPLYIPLPGPPPSVTGWWRRLCSRLRAMLLNWLYGCWFLPEPQLALAVPCGGHLPATLPLGFIPLTP
eukprot:TRINITY_DN7931_c0_g1_i1.p1 TRINITY_DN7931_c0_g1~~TRINITY_DN7931_c0_g1_i1.p1  ORF type:complete len:322 (+),score=70.81 TRINITY_DN7931_c0_g1_i1:74-1039(+)